MDRATSDLHAQRVAAVAASVRACPPGVRLGLLKARAGHTPHALAYKQGTHSIDLRELVHVLEVDPVRRTATVEGGVTLDRLCRATLESGLLPAVVPELDTFTVAGLIGGLGIETSSHRHGLFPDTSLSFEVVLGNGDVVVASATSEPELFHLLPGTFGTLGIVTAATLQLVPAGPFVRSRYQRFAAVEPYLQALTDATRSHDFVEGFVFARDAYALVTSDFADSAACLPVYPALEHGAPWYFQHVQRQAAAGAEDAVDTYGYLFRHQRGLFWVARAIAGEWPFSNTTWGRRHLDGQAERQRRSEGLTSAMPMHLRERCLVMQDLGVRAARLPEVLDWISRHVGVFPLWNCPFRTLRPGFFRGRTPVEGELLVDVGVYGEPTAKTFRHVETLQALQRLVDAPSLWGVSYLTRDDLAVLFDLQGHAVLQERYHAKDRFAPLETKVRLGDVEGPGAGPIPGWRYLNLWYDLKQRLTGA